MNENELKDAVREAVPDSRHRAAPGFNETWGAAEMRYEGARRRYTAIGAAAAIGRGDHISISYLVDKVRGKVKTLLNIIKYVIVGIVNAVMLWYSLPWIRSTGWF